MTGLEILANDGNQQDLLSKAIVLRNGTCPPDDYGSGLSVSTPEGLIIPENDLITFSGVRGIYHANNYDKRFAPTNLIGVSAYSPSTDTFRVHLMRDIPRQRQEYGLITANIVDILAAPVHAAVEEEADPSVTLSIIYADFSNRFYSMGNFWEQKKEKKREIRFLMHELREEISKIVGVEREDLEYHKIKVPKDQDVDYTLFFNPGGQIDVRIESYQASL